jgi:hypothetical protein
MSASVLIHGVLFKDPERRTSRAGKEFITAKVRDDNGDAVLWWRLICFSESAGAELLALRDGDTVGASGRLEAEAYDRGAGPKISLTCIVDRLITAKKGVKPKAKSERRQAFTAADAARPIEDGFNDPPWREDA